MIKRVYFLTASLTLAVTLLTAAIISTHSTEDTFIAKAKFNSIPLFKDGYTISDSPLPYNRIFIPDKDFDGISDADDPDSESNVFYGTMTGTYPLKNTSYTMDFRTFLGDETKFNFDLARSSLVFANTIYSPNSDKQSDSGFSYTHPENESITDITSLMSYHGFSNIQNINLGAKYNDNNITEVCFGFRDIWDGSNTARVIAVIIRGTNSSMEEWSSNFDVGNPDNWESVHHKGFKITTDRVKKLLDEYVYSFSSYSPEPVFWVTGHSRGAAISNLLSSYLINEGNKVFAYTFASPLVTQDKDSHNAKYDSIFNITGKNDVVTCIPFERWDFLRYGKTLEFSADDYSIKRKWTERTGEKAFNSLDERLINVMINETVKNAASNRNQYYELSTKQIFTQAQYNALSKDALALCNATKTKNIFSSKTEYEIQPSLAFVFQLIAEYMGEHETKSDGTLSKRSSENRNASISILGEFVNTKYAFTVAMIVGNVASLDLPSIAMNFGGIQSGTEIFKDSHTAAIYMVALDNHPFLSS